MFQNVMGSYGKAVKKYILHVRCDVMSMFVYTSCDIYVYRWKMSCRCLLIQVVLLMFVDELFLKIASDFAENPNNWNAIGTARHGLF